MKNIKHYIKYKKNDIRINKQIYCNPQMTLKLANKLYSIYIKHYNRYLNKKLIIDNVIRNFEVFEECFYGYMYSYKTTSCRYCNCRSGCRLLNQIIIKNHKHDILLKRQDIDIIFKYFFKKLSDINGVILSYLVKDICVLCRD